MSWTKLDDKFHSNRKVYEVGNEGAGLYARALSYCADHLTDGLVPGGWARTIASEKLCDKLVSAALWRKVDGGYRIDAYLEHNPSKGEVEARRQAWAEAGKRGAQRRWGNRVGNGVGHRAPHEVMHSDSHGPVPVPVPVPVNPPFEADFEVPAGDDGITW